MKGYFRALCAACTERGQRNVSRYVAGASRRTICQCFKGGRNAIPRYNVFTDGYAVGVSPNDSVCVLDVAVVLGVFRTDYDIVCLKGVSNNDTT